MPGPASQPPTEFAGTTSMHLARARSGDSGSIAWVVSRFSPLLLAQAEYRLWGRLRALYDPEDLVSETWVRVLPHLVELAPGGQAATPRFLRYASCTLLRRVRDLVEKHLQGKPTVEMLHASEGGGHAALLAAEVSGVVTRVARRELDDQVRRGLAALSPRQREIVILRGIEQNPNHEVAVLLSMTPNAVAVAYRRARQTLAGHLERSLLDALP